MAFLFLAADTTFPRGPGFYFSIVKILALLVVYLGWVKICAWVNDDANRLRMPTTLWNGVVVGCGLLGLFIVWLLPVFWFALIVLLFMIGSSTLAYIYQRDQKVAEKRKILSPRFWGFLNEGPTEEDDGPILIRFLEKSKGKKRRKLAIRTDTAEYRLTLVLVYNAIFQQASEILLEPAAKQLLARYRLAGDFQNVDPIPRSTGNEVLALFKTLSEINPDEEGPQRGRVTAEVDGRLIDLLVTTTAKGRMAIRILDRARKVLAFDQLGLSTEMGAKITSLLEQPRGLILLSSPPGAGKTNTLYSFLGSMDRIQRNVSFLDHYTELPLASVTQVEADEREGKTFAEELRGLVQAGNNVIGLGDVPDAELASLACQLAPKDRLILAVISANDSVTALRRLVEMGVPPASVAGSVLAVLNQRLVRLLCPYCKVAYPPNPEVLRQANLSPDQIKTFYRAPEAAEIPPDGGCEHCGGTGYQGRTGIFELLIVNDVIRKLIREKAPIEALRQAATRSGLKSLQDDGLRQVISGQTSIQELLRVCK